MSAADLLKLVYLYTVFKLSFGLIQTGCHDILKSLGRKPFANAYQV